jgi:hypothetical protein
MKHYPVQNWTYEGIIESRDHVNKYHAILRNEKLDITEQVSFGNVRETHFYDSTHLNNYSHLDTNNIKQRIEFIYKKHKYIKPLYYSSMYFELKYLYNFNAF